MVIAELQRIVLRVSNQVLCRWYAHFNYPCEEPWLMAIEIPTGFANGYFETEIIQQGFNLWSRYDTTIYVIKRTHEDIKDAKHIHYRIAPSIYAYCGAHIGQNAITGTTLTNVTCPRCRTYLVKTLSNNEDRRT